MEIRLTGEEFCAILSQHYGYAVDGFVITDADPSPKGKIIRQSVLNPLDKTHFMSNIKGLRGVYEWLGKHITLAEARWAIENWLTFIDFVDRTNRLPEPGFGSGKEKGILK